MDTYEIKTLEFKYTDFQIICFVHIAGPLTTGMIFMTILIHCSEEFRILFEEKYSMMCSKQSICMGILMIAINIFYVLYLFVTPTMCMTLFFLIAKTYESVFQQIIRRKAYHLLSTDMSLKNMASVVDMIQKSTKLFQDIEKALSFCVFLGYVLVFVNFLNLVSINVSTIVCPFVRFGLQHLL
ncbi:hypothetical protein CEXT_641661 [Caerostris extrusa]|uniref:Uncharacterized protein n=1 Tax=Caerostris extrusa TaxID=172846 RepID=A0AAV4QK64_CAEEX|nr:hypothetical protein CEXT_641661 [Caerostris extrusa]